MKKILVSLSDRLKNFDLKKDRKVVALGLACVLIFSLSLLAYQIHQARLNSAQIGPVGALEPATTLTADIADLSPGAPLRLVGEGGEIQSIQNGQTTEVAPGKYSLQTILDSTLGSTASAESGTTSGAINTGKAQSPSALKEQITVGGGEQKQVRFTLKPTVIDETKAAAKPLLKATQTKQILDLKPSATQPGDVRLNQTAKITYPNLVVPPSSADNSVAANSVVAIVQPLGAKYSLINQNNQNLANLNQGSLNSGNNNSNSNNGSLTATANSNSNSNSNLSNIQNSSSLAIATKDGQIALATGCEIGKVGFDSGGSVLKYFKACDNGQNGFYQYDLAAKKETQILPTSDSSNLIKVGISNTQNLMVWTKPDLGQFGIIQGGQIETILTNTFFTVPTFSPDGKYIVVMDNYLAAISPQQRQALKLSSANRDQFGLKVRVVKTADLLNLKGGAEFKQVGTTYHISRPIDYSFDFIYFLDGDRFMAGDSSKIFSLKGDPEDSSLENPAQNPDPGRIFVTSSGNKYRLFQNTLFNSKNQVVASFVNSVHQLQNKDFYFQVGNFLFRLVDDTPVQAYSKPISSASATNNTLTLILTDGQVVTF